MYTGGFFFFCVCDAGVSVVLSAGSRPGGSDGAVSHREQMVNGCVTRSIDFLTQTLQPVLCCFSLFSVIAETEYLLGFGHTGLRGNCDGLYHYSDILNKVS